MARQVFAAMGAIALMALPLCACDQSKPAVPKGKLVLIDYGILERPAMDDFTSFDKELLKRTPQQSIDRFREYERNIPQGLDWNQLEEHLDHQRALYYLALEKAPDLITEQDKKWLKGDEDALIESSCDNAESTGVRFKLPEHVCSKLPKR